MKKYLALLSSVLLLLSLFSGCAGSSDTETTAAAANHTLSVGYGRVDISPENGTPLGGYGNATERLSTEVTEALCATCVAFTDENDNTILLYHLDLTRSYSDVIPFIRAAVSKATGIPAAQIMVSATHTHSGPDLTVTGHPKIEAYKEMLKEQMIEVAKAALADRKPAKMHTATTYPEGLNYVRHYKLSDGTYGGDGFGSFKNNTIVSHASEADNQMQLIKFTREGGKDVLLLNWQGHPHRDGGSAKTHATSDIVGAMRTILEKDLDCHFAYFSGASGNINNSSRIAEEKITKDYMEHGEALSAYAVEAADSFKEVPIGKLQIIGETFAATRKTDTNATIDLSLFAFAIGDVAFITAPYEMFDTNGVAIKEASQFSMTFVITYANQHWFYIPSALAYEYGAEYEIGVSRFVPGTAELLEAEYISMLQELYKNR